MQTILSDERFEKLADIILEWNEKINVTAIRDREEFMQKNVQDSLAPLVLPEFKNAKTVLDLGTGGGFPGLPLAIACPEKVFFLVDSIAKKLKVVSDAALKLGLSNVYVLHSRAEDLAMPAKKGARLSVPGRELLDCVVSRAVANMSTLSEYCLPLVRPGGYFIAFKTENAMEEIEAAAHAIEILGGGEVRIDKTDSEDGHVLVIVKKLRSTPSKYPRRKGLPASEPLK
ncbi:MAG: 16S rRNA (guanine(527)-N(7))-methyltransferase RsmG [Firmicutes bacterium]|nr:16S rRNA (guanine(527)-N(7))-methyltransferase RsmG [Bacillota bacterium]